MDLVSCIRNVPDFPKKGIGFKDITTLVGNGPALQQSIRLLKQKYNDQKIDAVIGIESRGFIFAAVLAHEWGIGMIPVRKPGKLPYKKISETYELEYGTDTLEMHEDAVSAGQKVLIVDDLLATGGTAKATAHLVERLGAKVAGFGFVVELDFLRGRDNLSTYRVESLVHYDSE
ncbi:adenine phosphoribosyltransferase [candidate division KSB1 bacterium]|nr:adenine phosphoribosyltransferase [candidate division KSB1 bacterium]